MLIIVDGYNFIFTVSELEKYVGISRIEPVRDHVISLLSQYREKKHYDVILVFDGNQTGSIFPKKQMCSGIIVIYSKSGISADTEIKNITNLCQNPQDVCIVTYDNDIKRHVKKCGCQIIEPKVLYNEIVVILNKEKKKPSDEPESKQRGPSEHDAQYWKDVFKNIPVEESKSNAKNTTIPSAKKEKKKSSQIHDEPMYKYKGPPPDEVQYWVRFFTEREKDALED